MRTEFDTLKVSISGAVAEIVLDRPLSRNSITTKMHDELTMAFTLIGQEPDVRSILFAADGKIFCAGGDFDLILEVRAHPERRQHMAEGARTLFRAVATSPIPVIVALHGDAVGLGATLILGSDAIVASRNARISDPHVVIGLVAGDGGCVLWPQAVGLLRAKRYLLTGDRLTAADAHAMGLVTDLVDSPEEVRPAARTLAERIAGLPPIAVRRTKQALNHGLRYRIEEVFDQALEAELDTFFSEDVEEAIAAIRERRPGVYHGR